MFIYLRVGILPYIYIYIITVTIENYYLNILKTKFNIIFYSFINYIIFQLKQLSQGDLYKLKDLIITYQTLDCCLLQKISNYGYSKYTFTANCQTRYFLFKNEY